MSIRTIALVLLTLCVGPAGAQDGSYTVKPGDTLFSIARAAGVPMDSVRVWNGLENADLKAGMVLRIAPVTPPPTPQPTPTPSPDPTPQSDTLETVDAPDTLSAVFAAWGLEDCACAWADDVLVKRLPPDRSPTSYTVRRGDTLFGIARAHGVTMDAVRAANALPGTDIQIGRVLRIPGSDGSVDMSGPGALPPVAEEVGAVVYPEAMSGRRLGDGSVLTADRPVIGHVNLPLGTWVILESATTGSRVPAIVADRSPSPGGALIDISPALAARLGLADAPDTRVLIRPVPYVAIQR